MGEILNPFLDLPGDLAEAGREVTDKLDEVLHGLDDLGHGQVV